MHVLLSVTKCIVSCIYDVIVTSCAQQQEHMSPVDPVGCWMGTELIALQYVWLRMKHTYVMANNHVNAGDPDLSSSVFVMRLTV